MFDGGFARDPLHALRIDDTRSRRGAPRRSNSGCCGVRRRSVAGAVGAGRSGGVVVRAEPHLPCSTGFSTRHRRLLLRRARRALPGGTQGPGGRRRDRDPVHLRSGFVRLTEALNGTLAGRLPWCELARRIDVVSGTVRSRVRVVFGTRGDAVSPWLRPGPQRLSIAIDPWVNRRRATAIPLD